MRGGEIVSISSGLRCRSFLDDHISLSDSKKKTRVAAGLRRRWMETRLLQELGLSSVAETELDGG